MLEVKSYKEAAYEEIKDKIINGEYEPGRSLNERTLSEEFGISRTPVREALMQLSYEGWIINEPYKPNVVRNFDLETIIQAQRVRASLELLAIDESFNKFTDKDIKSLEEIVEETGTSKTHNEFIFSDRKFHEYFYNKSENKFLQSTMRNLNDIIRFFGLVAIDNPGRTRETIEEHNSIIENIKNRNKNKALDAMRFHMDQTQKSICKRYKRKK
ncbi:GntR family transcriptional regulator [Peptoniphilus sp. MSJ-1]|uniref:GntR family transcriptional regulator n=1 Tax=Peptoniphilus ovalis TaxID=2841503 RepID=A0ABS6FFN9_9FIRM|nr:GntR family transcriptional regulator [Peptoniphilus ovalis]MBU5668809.1 GntR family transcriptional regulator [Peptoniphilus ovalis]